MLTECNATLFDFAPVDGRQVAAFGGGTITSDAGALLLGETDQVIRLTARFASCFIDMRMAELVEHEVATMVLQRWSASRWAMKTSTITMNCGTIQCSRCWPANLRRSGRTARHLPASRH